MARGEKGNDTQQLRCHCGNLLARLVRAGVEIKCRRCKRTIVIPLKEDRPIVRRSVEN